MLGMKGRFFVNLIKGDAISLFYVLLNYRTCGRSLYATFLFCSGSPKSVSVTDP